MIKLSLVWAIALIFIFMLIVPCTLFLTLQRHKLALKWSIGILAVIYSLALFLGFFGSVSIDNGIITASLPFNGKWFYAHSLILYNLSIGNILVNLFIFFPVGYIIFVFCKKKRFLKTIVTCFVLSCCVEFLQFALPVVRVVELTDLFYNTLSGVISATFLTVFLKLFKIEISNDNTTSTQKENK